MCGHSATMACRVFFYLDDLIVMARSREWAMFHTAQLILHLTKLGVCGQLEEEPYLTSRRSIWGWCSMQAGYAPPCQKADRRPCCGQFADCDRGQRQIWARFGGAEVDLFTSRHNSHCALWFSMARRDNPPLGVDAFAHEPWPRKLLYAFPPLHLILPLLERLRREHLSVILVSPDRRMAPWFAEVTQMMVGQPWTAPQVWGALSQEAGAIGALPTLGQPLQAWFLKGPDTPGSHQ